MNDNITVSRELLRQVIEAAFSPYCAQDLGKLIPEIKQCLALQAVELEPVAWMMSGADKETRLTFNKPSAEHRRLFTCIDPLFTAPQAQPAPVQEPPGRCPSCMAYNGHQDWCPEAPQPAPAERVAVVGAEATTVSQTLMQWAHDFSNPATTEQQHGWVNGERKFAKAAPVQEPVPWNQVQVCTWIGNQLMTQPSMFERNAVCKFVRSLGRNEKLAKYFPAPQAQPRKEKS